MLNYQRVDGLPNLIAWWIFPWRTVSHNQVGYFFVDYQRLTMVMMMMMVMMMVMMMMMAVTMMVIFMSTKSTINLIYSMGISD